MPDASGGGRPAPDPRPIGAGYCMDGKLILEARDVSKRFGGATALDGVSLGVERGRILGLAGENGAGKSTLIKILCGVHRADSGSLELDGRPYRPRGPEDAERRGLSVFHQEIPVCPHLSIAANVFLGPFMPRRGLGPDWRRMNEECRGLYRDLLGEEIDPSRLVGDCTAAETQLALLVRVLSRNASLVVLDEPTTALTPPEVERLFAILRRLRDRGVSFVFVSHMLEELTSLSDRIAVLRDGRLVGELAEGEFDSRRLSSLIAGRAVEGGSPRSAPPPGEPFLEARGIGNGRSFSGLSFSLRAGGILGVAGLAGSGRSDLARSLFGSPPLSEGVLAIDGAARSLRSPADAIALGIGFVPEDRKADGLFHKLDVKLNLCMAGLERFSGGIALREDRLRREAEAAAAAVRVKMAGPDAAIGSLSGGNQQKVLIARWLALRPRLIVMSEPTRGVDVGAKQEILEMILGLSAEGCAFIIASSEIEELLALSDEILVMNRGRRAAILPRAEATKESVLLAATT
ncbi:MAG TPA: sugar ABC transporter ATP-binding protein [Spirochaetales bacterium]|nr:sugar ABC transporter ATP-binding protein [Spirochaetales bacterium]